MFYDRTEERTGMQEAFPYTPATDTQAHSASEAGQGSRRHSADLV